MRTGAKRASLARVTARRTISVQDRRRRLVARHHLAGTADGPEAVVRALFALHATDPASVYLSVLARSNSTTLADVTMAMYDRRELVRWMAMRRTLFVFLREDIPTVQTAASDAVAATLRRRLISQLERNGTEPPLTSPSQDWLANLETRVEDAIGRREAATGAQLAIDEPGLQTRVLARTASERTHNLTSPVLTMMSADGRIVRGTPTGRWTTRQHRWEPVDRWFPEGLAPLDPDEARRDLAHGWLERFGPGRFEDLQWWTGWNATTTRHALDRLTIEEVDLHGHPGLALITADEYEHEAPAPATPVAALLPALDPTPMGWKDRRWFLGIEPAEIFDRAGNIGPTVWWNGEIVGSWAIAPGGGLHWEVTADRGRQALDAVEHAAARLHARLEGAVVTPAARTPRERALAALPDQA